MEVWQKTRELLNSIADVTESGSKIARFKLEVANLDRKLGLALRRVGERVWQLEVKGQAEVLGDPEVRAALDEVRRMRARVEVIRQELERSRRQAIGEMNRSARLVKEEARRAAAAVHDESVKAVAAVKKAVAGKPPAKRKSPPKETSDLQP